MVSRRKMKCGNELDKDLTRKREESRGGKMNYYISNLHLGHANVIRFDNWPFADVNKMNVTLI